MNDPDGEPYPELNREMFIRLLMATGWARIAAEEEWEMVSKPVYLNDLEW